MRERCLRWPRPCRRYLEEEQLLDARYRLQEVAGGSVALPVLEGAEQRLRELQESGALELPCSLLRIQVGAGHGLRQLVVAVKDLWHFYLSTSHPQSPIPSKAASVRTPAQKLRSELRRMVLGLGESWSEELEHDVPRSWQRHGDLVLLSEDSFRAALWTKLGKGSKACSRGCGSQSCLASPSTAVLQAQRSGRRLPPLWVPSAWPGKDGCCQEGCGPRVSPCCWARTAGWSTWTTASGRQERAAVCCIGSGEGAALSRLVVSP